MIYGFIRYFIAWRRERRRELQYKIYVTNALKYISENTARQGGTYPTSRFADLIIMKKKPEQSGAEIAGGIIKGLNS